MILLQGYEWVVCELHNDMIVFVIRSKGWNVWYYT